MSLVDDALVERYLRVIQLNPLPGSWTKQSDYDQEWTTIKREPCTRSNIAEMLAHSYWIGCRAPEDGYTDRIAFDLDAGSADEVDHLFARYEAIRELVGYHRVPLVYHTPSGHGIRVVYRIPRTPLSELIEGARAGLVADVLRAANLPVKAGMVEVFPQPRLAERLPLGRRMPLLSADDLSVLGWAAIGDTFDRDLLVQSIEEMEVWHSAPDHELVEHLKSLPRADLHDVTPAYRPSRTSRTRRALSEPPAKTTSLVNEGLTVKRSRYEAEWEVGSAFIKWPLAFTDFGLGAAPSDDDVADAMARWVADKSNGLSEEWSDELKKAKSEPDAVRRWRKRYLRKGPDGRSMIGRLRTAAMLSDPGLMLVAEVSDDEAAEILEWADGFPPGAIRYRFEVWAWSAFRWLKAKCLKDSRLGTLVTHQAYKGDQPFVDYDLPARTMERWPFGGGRSKAGTSRYVQYADFLQHKIGWMKWQSGYFNPRRYNRNLPDDIKGKARTFTFPLPDLTLRSRDLRVSPGVLDGIIGEIKRRMGEPISRAEAYHALYVTANVPDLRARYKRDTAERVTEMAREIEKRVTEREL